MSLFIGASPTLASRPLKFGVIDQAQRITTNIGKLTCASRIQWCISEFIYTYIIAKSYILSTQVCDGYVPVLIKIIEFSADWRAQSTVTT